MTSNSTSVVVLTPEQFADIITRSVEQGVTQALRSAEKAGGDLDRLLKYEEAREYLGMGTTLFSRAVSDGALPYLTVGKRKKMFRKRDLIAFKGYTPSTEAERRFQKEIG